MTNFSTEQAIDIWFSRWQKKPVKGLVAKYGADPRRFYEIWKEEEMFGTRKLAMAKFISENPEQENSVDFSPHISKFKVVQKPPNNGQLNLFG